MELILLQREGRGIVRRFVFKAAAISNLRAKASGEQVPNLTRVEALSIFVWNRCMAAASVVWGQHRPSMLNYTVDLRRRMVPPLSSSYTVGNILWKVIALCSSSNSDQELNGMVGLLRRAMEKTKNVYVPKLQQINSNIGGACHAHAHAVRECFDKELKEACCDKNMNPYIFTSWCKIGLNQLDFGWGKPIWVSLLGSDDVDSIHKNNITLMEGAAAGNGGSASDKIEVWMTLDQREMAVLERDPDFLAFASPNPPILF